MLNDKTQPEYTIYRLSNTIGIICVEGICINTSVVIAKCPIFLYINWIGHALYPALCRRSPLGALQIHNRHQTTVFLPAYHPAKCYIRAVQQEIEKPVDICGLPSSFSADEIVLTGYDLASGLRMILNNGLDTTGVFSY